MSCNEAKVRGVCRAICWIDKNDLLMQDARRAPCTDHTLKIGDVVLGRVIRSQGKGSNVELVDDPRIVG